MRKIEINTEKQLLSLLDGTFCVQTYAVSTGKKGVGETKKSEQTPRGRHEILCKIGADSPLNTVFVSRRETGEIYSPTLGNQYPDRDWILTRILWLNGLDVAFNRFGECDTRNRYIYLHGTPDETPMGIPGSHGCIRLRNEDLISVFNFSKIGMLVDII